jgi:hypothetical protein
MRPNATVSLQSRNLYRPREQQVTDSNSRMIKRKRSLAGAQVTRLVQRLTELVAEQRLFVKNGCTDRLDGLDAEIDRLKWMLAGAVKRQLAEASAVRSS